MINGFHTPSCFNLHQMFANLKNCLMGPVMFFSNMCHKSSLYVDSLCIKVINNQSKLPFFCILHILHGKSDQPQTVLDITFKCELCL